MNAPPERLRNLEIRVQNLENVIENLLIYIENSTICPLNAHSDNAKQKVHKFINKTNKQNKIPH